MVRISCSASTSSTRARPIQNASIGTRMKRRPPRPVSRRWEGLSASTRARRQKAATTPDRRVRNSNAPRPMAVRNSSTMMIGPMMQHRIAGERDVAAARGEATHEAQHDHPNGQDREHHPRRLPGQRDDDREHDEDQADVRPGCQRDPEAGERAEHDHAPTPRSPSGRDQWSQRRRGRPDRSAHSSLQIVAQALDKPFSYGVFRGHD